MQLYLAVQLPQSEIERVVGLFDFDRRQWRDIDYTDMSRGGWDMTLHITRIYALAKTYEWPQSSFYKSPLLSELLHKAAGWWFDNRPVNQLVAQRYRGAQKADRGDAASEGRTFRRGDSRDTAGA